MQVPASSALQSPECSLLDSHRAQGSGEVRAMTCNSLVGSQVSAVLPQSEVQASVGPCPGTGSVSAASHRASRGAFVSFCFVSFFGIKE